MKKLAGKNIMISGLIASVAMVLIRQIEVVFTMGYYTDPTNAGLWSTLMMPNAGPPPPEFFVTSLLFTFATGTVLAAVFDFMKDLLGKGYWRRVIGFTDIMVGLAIVFAYFPMYLMFRVPLGLLIAWSLTSFVTIFVSAMIYAKRLR